MNDDSNFDDLESDSDFDEIDAIGNNSDQIEANVIIYDTELHNLDQHENSDIPANDDEPLPFVSVTSKIEKEKQLHEHRWRKIDFDIPKYIGFKPVTINPDPDILWTN